MDLTPDPSSCPGQLLRAYFRFKRAKWEVYELDPPPFGTSAENPGTHDLSLCQTEHAPGQSGVRHEVAYRWLGALA